VSKAELNLDVDAPEKVAGILRAAADAYLQDAEERMQAQPGDRTSVIWAAIAGLLDNAADAIEQIIKQRLDVKHSRTPQKE
jgi:hypothetical protein